MNDGTRPSDWLSAFAADVTSQFGEDGIIAKALDVIGERDGWCVEFGAWDGRHLSNTYDLIAKHEYSAVLIEADPRRFGELRATHGDNERVIVVNELVGMSADDGLDRLLAHTPVPRTFDLLSIDIDGADYHVWKAVRRYEPKIVVIEFNPSIPTAVEFVQAADPLVSHGSGLSSLVVLGKEKGYELVAATAANAVFVRDVYFPRFGIADNSPTAIRPNEHIAYVFQGFDGTIFVKGMARLSWHDWTINERRLQQLPKRLRKHPDRYSKLDRVLLRLYRIVYLRRFESGLAERGAPRRD